MAPHPTATYRLQLRPGFGFAEGGALAPYLAALGVSHVYLSPVLEAAPGSPHGYDVVDPTRLSDQLGGEEGWARLQEALRAHSLRTVVDIVPNHVAIPAPEQHNPAIWSVLAEGRDSPYAAWFDVDWEAQDGRMLMPVLGAPIGDCLDDLVIDGNVLRYHDHAFPLVPGTEGGEAGRGGELPELLDTQYYRLAYWRVGAEEINYRRFFDIDTLIGVRVEDPQVFAGTHARILRLLADGDVDGLRIDHPDGLADPRGYLERLVGAGQPGWVVVEKILDRGETLPPDWGCAGTTGYDALHAVGGLFVDPAGEQPLTDLYRSLTGAPDSFSAVVEAAKRLIARDVLAAEVNWLTDVLVRARSTDIALRDHTRSWLHEAVLELLVAFPVYRTYVRPGEPPSAADTAVLEGAARTASERRPDRRAQIQLARDLTLGRLGDGPAAREFIVRFQQVCAAVAAKGVEDTAFYRWLRLVSLNDVGGDPDRFGTSVAEFHAFCARLQQDWPATMTALTTHDTKRSEDVRARLAVLSELPREWGQAVTAWRARAGHRLDPDTEYLFWQTLVGAWPISMQRLTAYMDKAVREAKVHTAWTAVNQEYEGAVRDYVAAAYADRGLLDEVADFVARIAPYGWSNALTQKLVQLTMPGVPDLYQGTELWDLSLVDPDNRRPVDFRVREEMLAGNDADTYGGRRPGGAAPTSDTWGGETARDLPGVASSPRPPGVVRSRRRLRPHRRGRPSGAPLCRLRPRRRGRHRGHEAARRPGAVGLARHRAAVAGGRMVRRARRTYLDRVCLPRRPPRGPPRRPARSRRTRALERLTEPLRDSLQDHAGTTGLSTAAERSESPSSGKGRHRGVLQCLGAACRPGRRRG